MPDPVAGYRALQMLLMTFAGWLNREQADTLAYLVVSGNSIAPATRRRPTLRPISTIPPVAPALRVMNPWSTVQPGCPFLAPGFITLESL